jgi:hypothetical protein
MGVSHREQIFPENNFSTLIGTYPQIIATYPQALGSNTEFGNSKSPKYGSLLEEGKNQP